MNRSYSIASWLLQGIAAVILLQTLFFKFTAARESVYIFTAVGMEPWGRIGTGVIELIAAILLLYPRTVVYGAILSAGVISGAVFFHLFVLGITLPAVGDNGELFTLAMVVLLSSLGILFLHRQEIPVIGKALRAY